MEGCFFQVNMVKGKWAAHCSCGWYISW